MEDESHFPANDDRILGAYMKILNKRVSQRFASFYAKIVAQIGEPMLCLTQTPGRGECRFVDETCVVSLRTDLSKSGFEAHIAHELTHALQRKEGWPRVVSRYPDNSPVVEIGIMLVSIVLDLNVEDRLNAWGFDSRWIIDEQYRNLKEAVLNENIPPTGTLEWCKSVMMSAYASLTQPAKRWNRLKKLFLRRAPHIESKGEELASILRENGWSNPEQALTSLIAIRKSIGLSSNQIGIIDGKSGRRF